MLDEQRFLYYLLKLLPKLTNLQRLKMYQYIAEYGTTVTFSELLHYAEVPLTRHKELKLNFQLQQKAEKELYQEYLKTSFITILDPKYPQLLSEIYNPPALLFYQGDLSLLKQPALACIGARKMTKYGEQVTKKMIPTLVKKQFVIVSGLAQGIDTLAHQLTIRAKGATIAVIGSGLDIVYPKKNQRLQEYIGKNHLLLSEYPAGSAPISYHFPMRNRIIAGLSLGTCVIEAKKRSGTMITAQMALDAGRDVFCVPGSTLTPYSGGCNALIRQGAQCVIHPNQIVKEYEAYKKFHDIS